MWAVGTMKHLVLLVVVRNLRIHGLGSALTECIFCLFLGPEECFGGEVP